MCLNTNAVTPLGLIAPESPSFPVIFAKNKNLGLWGLRIILIFSRLERKVPNREFTVLLVAHGEGKFKIFGSGMSLFCTVTIVQS